MGKKSKRRNKTPVIPLINDESKTFILQLDVVLKHTAFIMIALPFLIFVLGFIKLYISIPLTALLLFCSYKHLSNYRNAPIETEGDYFFKVDKKKLITLLGTTLLIVAIWVYFSGIGMFSFQNGDFRERNAIFNDLINFDWPVLYQFPDTEQLYMLSYYIGIWLLPALVGKILGVMAANIALYMWVTTAVFICIYFCMRLTAKKPWLALAVFMLFSGMDIITWVLTYPDISPITPRAVGMPPEFFHLEWNMTNQQYSSMTTQLYWVFNQSIAAWLALSLVLCGESRKNYAFLFALTIFQSPLPSMGLIPFMIYHYFEPLFTNANQKKRWHGLWDLVKEAFSWQNTLGALSVVITTWLFFSINVSAGKNGFHMLDPAEYLVFVVFEFLVLAILLSFQYRKQPLFWLTVVTLAVIPFYHVGVGSDFCMRASIPALYILMLYSIKALNHSKRKPVIICLVVVLLIGSVTPIFEIMRSVVYTSNSTDGVINGSNGYTLHRTEFNTMLQDAPNNNFMGNAEDARFYHWLARK